MRLSAILVLAGLAAPPAGRLGPDRPVRMTAKGGIEIDLERRIGVAKDEVTIVRDDVTVCCDEAEARYAGQAIERVTCRGRVVIVRPDGTRATADVAVFAAKEDRVTLTGGAQVFGPDTFLAGERIVYDIARDRLTVDGEPSRFEMRGPKRPPPGRPCPPPDPTP